MMNPEPAQGVPSKPEESPWWLKYAIRFLGTVSAIGCLSLGVTACITLSPKCLLAGITQMLVGVVVGLVEAPCLCLFLDFAQVPSTYFDSKPPWHRSILFCVLAILPISLCPGLSTFFGSGLVFVTGCLYGIMALGKKAPADQMRMTASSSYNLLQNTRPAGAGDVEAGYAQQQVPKSGVI